jgi:hypothetical protein
MHENTSIFKSISEFVAAMLNIHYIVLTWRTGDRWMKHAGAFKSKFQIKQKLSDFGENKLMFSLFLRVFSTNL